MFSKGYRNSNFPRIYNSEKFPQFLPTLDFFPFFISANLIGRKWYLFFKFILHFDYSWGWSSFHGIFDFFYCEFFILCLFFILLIFLSFLFFLKQIKITFCTLGRLILCLPYTLWKFSLRASLVFLTFKIEL